MAWKSETIRKHIQVWAHKKALYDRHCAGETYVAIAKDIGVPFSNVTRHAHDWQAQLEYYSDYLQRRGTLSAKEQGQLDNYFMPLVDAGLIGEKQDIPRGDAEYRRMIAIKALMQEIEQEEIALKQAAADFHKALRSIKRLIHAVELELRR